MRSRVASWRRYLEVARRALGQGVSTMRSRFVAIARLLHSPRLLLSLVLACSLILSPLAAVMTVVPIGIVTPAKAGLDDCWDLAKDGVTKGFEDAQLILDPKFIECLGKMTSGDLVSVAVDGAFAVWGFSGKFDDKSGCDSAVETTIVQPLFDLFEGIPKPVKEFLNKTILALIPAAVVNGALNLDPPLTDPLTLEKLLSFGAKQLYAFLKTALPTVFGYIECGCSFAGTTVKLAHDAVLLGKEALACAKTFCLWDCDDDPPKKWGVALTCAPGDQAWPTDYSSANCAPNQSCQFQQVFYHPACSCGEGATEVATMSSDPTEMRPDQQKKTSQCTCPVGEGYQLTGTFSVTDPTTGIIYPNTPIFSCATCPPYSVPQADGSGCLACAAGEGAVTFKIAGVPAFEYCQICTNNLVAGENGRCGCPYGKVMQDTGWCRHCGSDEVIDGGACRQWASPCPDGLTLKIVSSDDPYKEGTATCERACPDGEVVNPVTGECNACGVNEYADYSVLPKVDQYGTVEKANWSLGVCKACASDRHSTAGSTVCCPKGFDDVGGFLCLPSKTPTRPGSGKSKGSTGKKLDSSLPGMVGKPKSTSLNPNAAPLLNEKTKKGSAKSQSSLCPQGQVMTTASGCQPAAPKLETLQTSPGVRAPPSAPPLTSFTPGAISPPGSSRPPPSAPPLTTSPGARTAPQAPPLTTYTPGVTTVPKPPPLTTYTPGVVGPAGGVRTMPPPSGR